jgi:conjugal transfer pilus assembly protein TraF
MLRLLLGFTAALISMGSYGLHDQSFAHGWYWGEDEVIVKRPKDNDSKIDVKTMTPKYSQRDVLKKMQDNVEELKVQAILNPIVDNVSNYIKAQNKMVNLATNFSEGWQRALLLNPELDYTAKNPTNNYARRLISDAKQQDIEQYLSKFSSEYGLVFFFDGNDNISLYQSKMIKDFVTRNNITLISVSMSGAPNQYFNAPEKNRGQAEKLNVTVTPAIIALHAKSKEAVPMVYGVTTENELIDRIYNLYQKGY